jgi:hypothetical protein
MRFDLQLSQRHLIGLRLRFVAAGALRRYQHREGNTDAIRCNPAEFLGTVGHNAQRNAFSMQLAQGVANA